jgi:tetratricopeptide (TPR) repeat protein
VLTQAAQAAEQNDDVPTHWRARLDRVIARTAIDPGNASIHEHELLAREAIRVLERHGDDRGMARAWIVIGQIEEMRGRVSEGEQAAQHVLRYARRGGTYREVAFARFGIAEAILAGQLPADAGIARCDELLPALTDLRVGDVALLAAAALLHAMRGEFHAGRQLIAQGRELVERLGHTNPLVFTLQRAGELELIAADAAAAETTFRQALCLADRSGNSGARAEVAALLARAVLAQGREAEAQELAAQARAGSEPERLPAQARWRAVQAAIHTARGETEDAVVLAAAADDMLRETELLPLRAEVLTDLAVALAAHGDNPAAGRAAQRALDVHIRKGNIVGAASVRQQFGLAATTEARS